MRKRYFKLLTLIMVSILMLMVFTACGDSKSSGPDSNVTDDSKDSAEDSPKDNAPEPDEMITLSIGTSVYVEAPHRKAIDGLIEAYNQKNPNVQIEIFGAGYDNFWDNLTTEILQDSIL